MKKKLKLEDIKIDGGTQIREKLCTATVSEYAEAYEAGAKFPPLKVCYDGKHYWLYDGFHRWHAIKKAGGSHAEVEVFQGTLRDAKQLAAGANSDHGLKRTNADKRAAVLVFLEDEEWVLWSDRRIADAAGVGVDLVSEIRRQLSDSDSSSPAAKTAGQPRVGKDGKSRKPPKPSPKRNAVSDYFEEKGAGSRQSDEAKESAASPPSNADLFKSQKSKTVKTAEALMRAFEDLNELRKSRECGPAVESCKALIQKAKNW